MKKEPNVAKYGCILFVVVLIIVGLILLNGLVAKVLFNWILVDSLHLFNAHISYWTGLGISLLLWFVGSFFKSTRK